MVLTWSPPLHNTDGSALIDLAGYHVNYGTNLANLTNFRNLTNATLIRFEAANLTPGTWYFSIQSYNARGDLGPPVVVSQTV